MQDLRITFACVIGHRLRIDQHRRISYAELDKALVRIDIEEFGIPQWHRPAILAEDAIIILFSIHTMMQTLRSLLGPLNLLADVKVEPGHLIVILET